jgi:hypothetical protein
MLVAAKTSKPESKRMLENAINNSNHGNVEHGQATGPLSGELSFRPEATIASRACSFV